MLIIKISSAQKNMLDQIYEIENQSFSVPWSKYDLEKDFFENKISIYFVAQEDNKIVAYAGMWHIITEGHITNIAVAENYRGRGIGSMLLERLIKTAQEKEMLGITLEVRRSNVNAIGLYNKYGFKEEGIRKNYYQDTKEDAIIMWKYFHKNS